MSILEIDGKQVYILAKFREIDSFYSNFRLEFLIFLVDCALSKINAVLFFKFQNPLFMMNMCLFEIQCWIAMEFFWDHEKKTEFKIWQAISSIREEKSRF